MCVRERVRVCVWVCCVACGPFYVALRPRIDALCSAAALPRDLLAHHRPMSGNGVQVRLAAVGLVTTCLFDDRHGLARPLAQLLALALARDRTPPPVATRGDSFWTVRSSPLGPAVQRSRTCCGIDM